MLNTSHNVYLLQITIDQPCPVKAEWPNWVASRRSAACRMMPLHNKQTPRSGVVDYYALRSPNNWSNMSSAPHACADVNATSRLCSEVSGLSPGLYPRSWSASDHACWNS